FATLDTIRQSATVPFDPLRRNLPVETRLVPVCQRGNCANLRGHFNIFPQNSLEADRGVAVTPKPPERGIPVQDSTGKNRFHSGVLVYAYAPLPGGGAAARLRPRPPRPGKARCSGEKDTRTRHRFAA